MGSSSSKTNAFEMNRRPLSSFHLPESLVCDVDKIPVKNGTVIQKAFCASRLSDRILMLVAMSYHIAPVRVLVLSPISQISDECYEAFCGDQCVSTEPLSTNDCTRLDSMLSFTTVMHPLPCLVIQTLYEARVTSSFLERYDPNDFPVVLVAEAQYFSESAHSLIRRHFHTSNVLMVQSHMESLTDAYQMRSRHFHDTCQDVTDMIVQSHRCMLNKRSKRRHVRALVVCTSEDEANELVTEANLRYAPSLYASSDSDDDNVNMLVVHTNQILVHLDWSRYSVYAYTTGRSDIQQYVLDRLSDMDNTSTDLDVFCV